MAQSFQLISRGIPIEGATKAEVRENLRQHFKNEAQIEALLSGSETIIKRADSKAELERSIAALYRCGLQVRIAVVGDEDEEEEDEPLVLPSSARPEMPMLPAKRNHKKAEAKVTTVRQDPKTVARKITQRERFKYLFDTYMAGGSSAMFKALIAVFLASIIVVGLFRALFFLIAPGVDLQNDVGFFGNIYTTFLQLTDPGNMAQDIFSSPWYKFFAVLAGMIGVIIFSSLIAFITSALEQKMRELRQGRSKIVEQDHTLILGWHEERIVEILRELIMANDSEDYACVVILADEDKEYMDEHIRLRIKDTGPTRIVTRSGAVTLIANLEKVDIRSSKSVIVLAECKDTDGPEKKLASDAKVIQAILAVSGMTTEQTIVAELFNLVYRDIVESTLSENVVVVNTSDILAKLLVQTSRSVGLSVVYNEILSFDGCEIYFFEAKFPNVPFSELSFYFHDGVILGFKNSGGKICLNPHPDTRLQEGDEIIILADDDSTVILQEFPVVQSRAQVLPGRRLKQKKERQLLIGWNEKSPTVIAEFADYVVSGEIDVLLKNPTDYERDRIRELDKYLPNLVVRLVEKDYLNRDDLLSLEPFHYDNIIILSSHHEEGDAQQVDSENIVCLLLLRHIFQAHQGDINTKLITEVMDFQNQTLVAQTGVKDVIISTRLLSMIISQVSENKDIKQIYDDIFQEDGSEIYLKPIDLYYDTPPNNVSFAQLMRQAQARGEVCLGVKIHAQETDADANFGVELIPEKHKTFDLKAKDCLVVLAEDEL